jgi:phosphohistidine phosphatase
MKTLLVLRHAKSSWRESELSDHDRPLNKRGKRDAPRMGELIRAEDLLPDLILTSSARRALTTAELVAEASGYEGEIQVSRDLYAAGPEEFIDALCALPDGFDSVLVIGHNPGLEELVEVLTEEAPAMPTATLAQVALDIDRWVDLEGEGAGRLVKLWLPRTLT